MTGAVTVFVVSGDPKADIRFGELAAAANLRLALFDSPASLLKEFDPDLAACLVLDLRWPWKRNGGNGASSGLRLCIESSVVFVTGPREESLRSQAVHADLVAQNLGPVDGWSGPPTLLAAIEWVAKHHLRLRTERSEVEAVAQRQRSLTRREHEVMEMVVDGMSNREIADCLGISARTIEIHRARVMEKMGAQSLSDLVRMVCYRSVRFVRREPQLDAQARRRTLAG
jgi:FixJ family two-component response regulator